MKPARIPAKCPKNDAFGTNIDIITSSIQATYRVGTENPNITLVCRTKQSVSEQSEHGHLMMTSIWICFLVSSYILLNLYEKYVRHLCMRVCVYLDCCPGRAEAVKRTFSPNSTAEKPTAQVYIGWWYEKNSLNA